MAKYVYNENEIQTFNSAIGIIFGDNVRNKIETSIHKADEKEHKLMVTYDDLIRLWNYGVEHGIEGYKKYSCKEMKKVENAIKVLMDNGNLFFKNYEGKVSPISYCKVDNGKIFFME